MHELTWKPDPWMLALCLGLLICICIFLTLALVIAGKKEQEQRDALSGDSDHLTSELLKEDDGE